MTDPYPSDRAYIGREFARLDELLRVEIDRFAGPIDEFGALYISEAEVRRILDRETIDGAGQPSGVERHGLARHAESIRERRRATTEAGNSLRFDRLADSFNLTPVEREALLIAMAPDVDEKYATIYAYLQDDVTRRRPTVGFIVGLLRPAVDQLEGRSLFAAGAPLVDSTLLRPEGNGPLPTRQVRPDPYIVSYLLGDEVDDPALAGLASVTQPTHGLDTLDITPTHHRALASLVDRNPNTPSPVVVLYGANGTRKAQRIAAICAEQNLGLVTVDGVSIPSDSFAQTIDRAGRDASLRNAAIHIAGVLDDERAAEVAMRRLDHLDVPIYLTGESPPSNALRSATSRREFIPYEAKRADYTARRRYWASLDALPEGIDPAVIASTFRMSRGEIDDAVAMARAIARGSDEPLAASHVYAACRAQSSEGLTALATRIEPSYGWDDIVLTTETEMHLREVADRLIHRGTVYTDWGFGEQSSLGNGIVALFSGASGTGKTMAAEVVANHAGLHLYKVDLAEVVSKYVGETESNLARVFEEAADTDAVLLFDEADALFGERSEISDAHDRYANIEIDYLLQRVEEHNGAVILTTNLESNIDDAFTRRIHLKVEFPLPDRAARTAIWRRVFPDETPVGEVDYEYLARLDLTGGNIRNIALTAAFYAADGETTVGMEEIVRAVKRECQKIGIPIQPDEFSEYRDLVEPT